MKNNNLSKIMLIGLMMIVNDFSFCGVQKILSMFTCGRYLDESKPHGE